MRTRPAIAIVAATSLLVLGVGIAIWVFTGTPQNHSTGGMTETFRQRLEVDVDYSQFELRLQDDPDREGEETIDELLGSAREQGDPAPFEPTADTPTVQWVSPDVMQFIVAREYGSTLIETVVYDAAPDPDPAWDEVVELSFTATHTVTLAGWASVDSSDALPLDPGVSYRLRYSIRGAQASWGEDDGDEYRVELWPSRPSEPQLIRTTSEWGAYWVDNWHERDDRRSDG